MKAGLAGKSTPKMCRFPWRRPEIQSRVVSRPNADGRVPGPSWSRGDLHPRSRVCKRSTPIPNAGNAPGMRDSGRAPRLSSAGVKVVAQTLFCREEILFWKSAFFRTCTLPDAVENPKNTSVTAGMFTKTSLAACFRSCLFSSRPTHYQMSRGRCHKFHPILFRR